MTMQGKIDKYKTWKEDPVFVLAIWLVIIGLAPVWLPLHLILRVLGRRGFMSKGYYDFPGWGYTWVIELSPRAFKSIESRVTLKRTDD